MEWISYVGFFEIKYAIEWNLQAEVEKENIGDYEVKHISCTMTSISSLKYNVIDIPFLGLPAALQHELYLGPVWLSLTFKDQSEDYVKKNLNCKI